MHAIDEGIAMESACTMEALQRLNSELMVVAQDETVCIIEQGVDASNSCGEGVFEKRLSDAIECGLIDIAAGRYVTSIDVAFDQALLMRTRHTDGADVVG